jgi:large conductance mechanosensitive channel
MLDDFKKFLFRGNVIDLAVAVIIGAAFTAIVTAIVTGLVTPLVGMIFSKDFSKMTFEVNDSTFNYGIVINAVIYFVSVAAVVFFFIVKPMQALMDRRARGEEPVEAEPTPSDEAVLLTEIRDLLAQRTA